MITLTRSLRFESGAEYYLYEDVRHDFVTPQSTHLFHQFQLILEGELTHRQNERTYTVKPNDLVFTPAGVWHGLTFDQQTCRYLCLSFTPDMTAGIFSRFPRFPLAQLGEQCVFHLSASLATRLESLLTLLLQEQSMAYGGDKSSGEFLVQATLLEWLRSLEPEPDTNPNRLPEERAVQTCVNYIAMHYMEDITIEQLAKVCAMSKTDLYRHFPRITGKTVRQFVAEQRIQEAARLVGETDQSITAIAERVGYPEFSTFYRNFVRIIQCTPSEYRALSEPLRQALLPKFSRGGGTACQAQKRLTRRSNPIPRLRSVYYYMCDMWKERRGLRRVFSIALIYTLSPTVPRRTPCLHRRTAPSNASGPSSWRARGNWVSWRSSSS